DVDVDLFHLEPGHALDLASDVAPHGISNVHNALAVVGDDVEVDRRLTFADLDGDPLRCLGAVGRARHERPQLPNSAGHPSAHRVHARYVAGGHASDLRHDTIPEPGGAGLASQRHAGARAG